VQDVLEGICSDCTHDEIMKFHFERDCIPDCPFCESMTEVAYSLYG